MFNYLDEYWSYKGKRDKVFHRKIGVSTKIFRFRARKEFKYAYITVGKFLFFDKQVNFGNYGTGLLIYGRNRLGFLDLPRLERAYEYIKSLVNKELLLVKENELKIIQKEMIEKKVSNLNLIKIPFEDFNIHINVITFNTKKLKDNIIPENNILPIYVIKKGKVENVGIVRNYEL